MGFSRDALELLPPQLMPTMEPIKSNAKSALLVLRCEWLLGMTRIGIRARPPTPKQAAARNRSAPADGRAIARVRDVVEMERVVETVAKPGVTEEGLKLQDAPLGRPEHMKSSITAVYGISFGVIVRV